jgi:hypothetical protein
MNRQAVVFLMPIAALLIIGAIIGMNWWKGRVVKQEPSPIPFTQETELSEEGQDLAVKNGMNKEDSIQLKKVKETVEGIALANLSDDRKSLTVAASLPEITKGYYQVWLQKDGNTVWIGVLEMSKAGYMLDYQSATPISEDTRVVISQEMTKRAPIENELMGGQLKK